MFENRRANKEVERVISLSATAATLPMRPFPVYNEQVRFELLFLFFFLLDYREFHKLDQSLRTKILEVFIARLSEGIDGEDAAEFIDALYDHRIGVYYSIMQRTKTIGDFLQPASVFIEAAALYQSDTGGIAHPGMSIADMKAKITSPLKGKLQEPIAMAISMSATTLL